MNWWQALVLGIVEGVTEFLPVSSTGHLLIVQELMGVGSGSPEARAAANAYAICIQAGAILAVLHIYRDRAVRICRGWAGRAGLGLGDDVGFRLGLAIVLAFLPAAVIGLLLDDLIEALLFGPWPIVTAWGVGGAAILLVERWRRGRPTPDGESADPAAPAEEEPAGGSAALLAGMSWKVAVGIGLFQCLAMWPGTSRSLVTILGGVLLGLPLVASVEFSFLLGLVTLLAATVYKAREAGPIMLEAYGWAPMGIGVLAAGLSAWVAVKWMVSYLQRHGLGVFGWYRLALALAVAGWLAS